MSHSFSRQDWVSASFILVLVALASKGLGFLRDILMARYFGTSGEVDAFMVALSIPMVVGGGIGFALSTALVPTYQKILLQGGTVRANQFAGWVTLWGAILSIMVMLPLWLYPRPIVIFVAPSLSLASLSLAENLVMWLALYLVGLNLVYILTAVYHALHHFKIPALSDLMFNVAAIIGLVGFASSLGIHALVFGHLAGIFLCFGILALLLAGQIRGLRVESMWPSLDMKELLLLTAPLVFLEVSSQIGQMVENYFASGLGEGSIAALNYAKKLTSTATLLVSLNIARGAFPTLAGLSSAQQHEAAMAILVKIIKQLIILFVPLAVLLTFRRNEILGLVYLGGAFDTKALEKTAQAFVFYSAVLWIAAIEPVFLRACYAFSDAWTPLLSMVISIALMALLAYALRDVMGVSGIALAANAAILSRVLIQGAVFQRIVGGRQIKELLRTSAMALLCALVAWLPVAVAPTASAVMFLASATVFFACYLGVSYLIMQGEIKQLWLTLKRYMPASS